MDGIHEIAREREEQLTKHQRTVVDDALFNDDEQLASAAMELISSTPDPGFCDEIAWNPTIWEHMTGKSYRDRLIIAGALIAAEIDRLDYIGAT
jgi:hypothetical protein